MADIVYFRKLCDKKRNLENRINEASDYQLMELLEEKLRCVDKEISLIIAMEKALQNERRS